MLPAFRAAFEVLCGLRLLPPGGLYYSMVSFFQCWRVVVLPVFLIPGGIVVVVFLTPAMASSLVIFLMPSVASPLSSSSYLGWHHHCCLPHARCGIVACHLPHAQGGISIVVFLMSDMVSPLMSVKILPRLLHAARQAT